MATLIPPPQYDVPPSVPAIEYVLPWSEVQNWCFKLAMVRQGDAAAQWVRRNGVGGCSAVSSVDGHCLVYRIDDAAVARHERAHCNGWPSDHPGGR
jgi:hypothetical protein